MDYRRLLKPKFLLFTPLLVLLVVGVACGSSAPAEPIVVEKEVVKEVIKEVVVEKEVIKEVPVEVVVEKEVVKEVIREVPVIVLATPPVGIPTAVPAAAAQLGEVTVGGTAPCNAYSAPTFWDLHRGAAANDVVWGSPLYNGLIELNPETDDYFDIRGDLAKSWEVSGDGLSFTFFLHENARWHDGEPVTAEDVVWSIDRMVDPDEPRPRAGLIKAYYESGSSQVIDEHTVKVTTKFPSAAFGGFMAADYNKIFPKHVYAPPPDGKGLDPNKIDNVVGSGPFVMDRFKKDVVGEYRRFDDYFKKDAEGRQYPYLDGIDKFLIIDRGTLAAAVRTGRILFACGETHIAPSDLIVMEKEMGGKLKLYFDLPAIYSGFWVNTKHLPWSDVRLRKALHLGIDRAELIAAIGPIGSEILGAPLQPGAWFGKTQDDLAKLPGWRQPKDADRAEARRLVQEVMKDAGFDFPYKTVLRFRNVAFYPLQAPVLKEHLKAIGIEVELEQMESAAGFQAWERGDAEIALQATSFAVFEPDAIVNTFYTTGAGRNYADWDPDPLIDELFKKQAQEFDREKRREILQEIEDHLLTNFDSVWTHIMWSGRLRFAWDNIMNFHTAQSSQGELKFEHIWLKQ